MVQHSMSTAMETGPPALFSVACSAELPALPALLSQQYWSLWSQQQQKGIKKSNFIMMQLEILKVYILHKPHFSTLDLLFEDY